MRKIHYLGLEKEFLNVWKGMIDEHVTGEPGFLWVLESYI